MAFSSSSLTRRAVLTMAVAAAASAGAHAQSGSAPAQWMPSRPVHIVVPFPPGGGIDILMRAISVELSKKWSQSVVIDNKGGASTLIGSQFVAHAPADGYTLLATTDPTFTANRHIFKQLPYDPDKSFTPAIQMAKGDNIIIAIPTVAASNLKELVAQASQPGSKLSFSSYGNGTQPQLVFEFLNKRENLHLLHVPYKGIAPAMMAIQGKEVDLSVASASVVGEMIKAGKVKPLAVAGDKRMSLFPDIPTAAEQGFPYLRSFIWYGLFAPAGTPAPVIARLNQDIAAILQNKAFAQMQLLDRGLTFTANSPQEFAKMIQADTALVGEMIKTANIQPE